MTHQWPILTWSYLSYLWEVGVCWAGKGGWELSGGMRITFVTRVPRLPHPPCAAALLLRIQWTGLAFPSFHPNQTAQPEVKEQGRHHRSSIFETESWGKFKTFLHFLIVAQLKIRSLSHLLRPNILFQRNSLYIPKLHSTWWESMSSC